MKYHNFLNKLIGFDKTKPFLIIASLLLFSQCDKNPVGYHDEEAIDQDELELSQNDYSDDVYEQENFKIQPGKKEKFIVLFKNRSEPEFIRKKGGNVRYSYSIVPAVAVSLTQEALNRIESFEGVRRIERDGEIHALDTELDNSWGVKRIGSGSASNKGNGVKIGIVDSGIDYNHSDLDGNYRGGYDFMNNDSDPMDDHGHGTHVAGIIAAEDNGSGVVGVAPKAKIYALKVLNSSGSGNWSNVIAALDWAVNNGLKIVNHSYGGSSNPGQTVIDAFENAKSAGIIHVAAAGNSGNPSGSGSNVEYPGNLSSVIAVAATDYFNNRASFSSTGSSVELAAPGVSVNSTKLGGGYSKKSGTSTAAPHVAGALAIAIAAGNSNPRGTLKSTADDLGPAGKDEFYGNGMVNAEKASSGSGSGSTPPSTPNEAPTVTITQPSGGSTFNTGTEITFSGTASDPENGNLTSFILWTSSIDGYFATGSTVSHVLSTGNHVITAKATDAAGLAGSTTINISVQTPNSAPTLSISQPGNGSTFTSGSVINFVASANDSEDGNLGSQISWSSNLSGQLGTGSSITATLSDGSHQVTAQVSDSANLSASASISISITVPQNQAPAISISLPQSGSSYDAGTKVTFSGSANDAEDGNLSSQIVWSSNIDGNVGNGASFEKELSSGTHSITAKVTDSKDLSATSQVNIIIESEPDPANSNPSVTILNPLSGSTFNTDETINFSGNASDQEDGNLSDELQWNSNHDGLMGYGSSITFQLSVGTHTITAKATDGESANGTASISVTIAEEEESSPPSDPPAPPPAQNTPPSLTITQPNNNSTFDEGESILLTASANDQEDGNLSSSIVWNSSINGYLGTGSSLNFSLNVGQHTITATVTDSENASVSATVSISIMEKEAEDPTPADPPASPPAQNAPPTVTIDQPFNGASFEEGTTVALLGSATDPESGNLSSFILWNSNVDGHLGTGSSVTANLSNGEHTVTAKVSDSENVSSTATITVTVFESESEVDAPETPDQVNSPPTVAIIEPILAADYSVNQSIVFSGYSQDTEDGDLSYNIKWYSNIDGYLGVGSTLSSLLSTGNHTIEASVTDSGNLRGSANISITVSTEETDDGSNNDDDDNDRNQSKIYLAKFEQTFKQYGNKKGEKIDLISVIEIRHDSNLNGLKDTVDEPIVNAVITILISGPDGQSWTLTGLTGKDGVVEITLGRVPLDFYKTSILEVSHSEYKSYDPAFGNETVSANYYLN